MKLELGWYSPGWRVEIFALSILTECLQVSVSSTVRQLNLVNYITHRALVQQEVRAYTDFDWVEDRKSQNITLSKQ